MSSETAAASFRYVAIAWAGCAALAVAMGIGRFAFTPVLPLMQQEHGVSLADAGWLAASNYVGYFLGSFLVPLLTLPPRTAIRGGLVTIALVTAAMALVDGFVPWLVLRGLAGVASAVVFVAVSAWGLSALAPSGRPLLNATVYSGVGSGVAAAGLICVAIVRFGHSAEDAWLALAAMCLVAVPAWSIYGRGDAAHARAADRATRLTWNAERVRLLLAYGFLGYGYIVPATFLPAMAKHSLADPQQFVWAWPIFGAAAAVSTVVLAWLPKSSGLRGAWMAAQSIMAAGVVLPLFSNGQAAILASALAVGGTFMVVTASAIQEARRTAPESAASFIAAMTASFALGQIAGPIVVSALANVRDVYTPALASASVLLISGVALLAMSGRQAANTANAGEST